MRNNNSAVIGAAGAINCFCLFVLKYKRNASGIVRKCWGSGKRSVFHYKAYLKVDSRIAGTWWGSVRAVTVQGRASVSCKGFAVHIR